MRMEIRPCQEHRRAVWEIFPKYQFHANAIVNLFKLVEEFGNFRAGFRGLIRWKIFQIGGLWIRESTWSTCPWVARSTVCFHGSGLFPDSAGGTSWRVFPCLAVLAAELCIYVNEPSGLDVTYVHSRNTLQPFLDYGSRRAKLHEVHAFQFAAPVWDVFHNWLGCEGIVLVSWNGFSV